MALSFGSALWGPAWIVIAHYIEKWPLVQVKHNVLKKVISYDVYIMFVML